MTPEKQIEEMAKDLGIAFQLAGTTRFGAVAEILVNAGYRKIHDDNAIQCVCYALGCQAAEKIKSDVAREIFAEIQAEIKAALDSNYKALPQVEMSEELWSCVRGKIDCLRGLDDFIDELKKKYTGVDENAER